jgi:hypothetical protein
MAKRKLRMGILWKFRNVNTTNDVKVVTHVDTDGIRNCGHDRMAQFGENESDHQCLFCKEIFKLEIDPDSGEDRYLQVTKQ